MKRKLFVMAVIFSHPSFGFAQINTQDNMKVVPKRALLEGEVIGSHATPTDIQMFPKFAVLLGHGDYGLVHCCIHVEEAQPFKRT